jgi:hypothetical protein
MLVYALVITVCHAGTGINGDWNKYCHHIEHGLYSTNAGCALDGTNAIGTKVKGAFSDEDLVEGSECQEIRVKE